MTSVLVVVVKNINAVMVSKATSIIVVKPLQVHINSNHPYLFNYKQNNMNIPILIANTLTLIAFFLHAFVGDKGLKFIEPKIENVPKQGRWTLARCGWHLFTIDLLYATIGLGIINFSDYFENEELLLKILAIYFFGYGIAWLVMIALSKKFPMNYLKLPQWILCLVISGLIYLGTI